MPKFFVRSEQISGNTIEIIGEDVNHIVNVLRLKIGCEIKICNTETSINYIAKISSFDTTSVLCDIVDCVKSFVESSINITVFQGLPKADKMEYIIQKSVELGAKKIVPVSMQRSIVKLDDKKSNNKISRWQKIAEMAAKQSGRDLIPEIENVINLRKVCELVKDYDILLIAYENEEKINLKTELKKLKQLDKLNIGVIIGPEGGFDEKEVEMLIVSGAKKVSLGKRILRTETTAIVMISNIIYEFEM